MNHTALRTDAEYCSKAADDDARHNCETCSLVDYGRDCHNNPIAQTDTPYYLLNAGLDRERAHARQTDIEPPDHTDDACPCGDVDCSRPIGHA